MFELDPDAYAEASRRERVRFLMSLYGRIAGYIFLAFILLLVFSPDPLLIVTVGGHSNARRASCASNLKQLSIALTQYEQDDDGNPPAYQSSASGSSWREAVFPYVKATGVYQCPDDTRHGDYTPENLPRSYEANDMKHSKDELLTPMTALAPKGTSVNTSLRVIQVVDTRGYDGADWDITSPMFLPGTGRELYAHVPRHIFYEHPSGILNCLFTDGHVKAVRPSATLAPVNLWTRDSAPFTGRELKNARAILKHAEDE